MKQIRDRSGIRPDPSVRSDRQSSRSNRSQRHSSAPLPDDAHRCQQETTHEAYVSAQHPASSQEARFPEADANSCWPSHHFGSPPEGSRSVVGLIGRLRRRNDFYLLRRDGRTVRRGSLQVGFRATGDEVNSPGPRVAYAIPRLVGPAVVRNRIRRRLRAIVVDLDRRPQGVPVGDYLVRVSSGAADSSHDELRLCLTGAIDSLADG